MVRHLTLDQGIEGSNPSSPAKSKREKAPGGDSEGLLIRTRVSRRPVRRRGATTESWRDSPRPSPQLLLRAHRPSQEARRHALNGKWEGEARAAMLRPYRISNDRAPVCSESPRCHRQGHRRRHGLGMGVSPSGGRARAGRRSMTLAQSGIRRRMPIASASVASRSAFVRARSASAVARVEKSIRAVYR